ncbi:MAG: hypothetical protein CMQ28_02670, partial [Gammaproteobacteria bacterium]|nr:hypothetical protein [Gammaproteobacteria bacterium]
GNLEVTQCFRKGGNKEKPQAPAFSYLQIANHFLNAASRKLLKSYHSHFRFHDGVTICHNALDF